MGTVTGSVTLHPSGYTGQTSFSIASGSAISNGYTDVSSTTYARFTLSTSTTGYIYYTFDCSEIPDGATITSITGTVKVRRSSTSRVTSPKCQLFTGTTAKGSNIEFSNTSGGQTVTLSAGSSWTRTELNDLRLKIGGTGSTSSQSKQVDFYGASITINYSITAYDITITNNTAATVQASANSVASGDSVTIHADTVSDIVIQDNGIDVTAQFVTVPGGSVSQTPEEFTTELSASGANFYTGQNTMGNYFSYAVGHTAESPGSTSTSENTYVKDGGSNVATGWAIYSFDFSSIPAFATITSVTVKCYGAAEDTTYNDTRMAEVSVYSGNTLKGAASHFTSKTNSILTISNVGTWTRAELQDAKLHFKVAYYGGRMYGCTWTVTYTVDGYEYVITNVAADHAIVVASSGGGTTRILYKTGGSWAAASKVYKKVNGSWVQQSNLAQVFDGNTNYVKG